MSSPTSDRVLPSRIWPRLTPPQIDLRLPTELAQHLASIGRVVDVPRNGLVERQGQQGSNFYLVLSGRIHLFIGDGRGKEVHVNTVYPGEGFGEACLVPGVRSTSARAAADSKLISVERSVFEDAVRERPDLALLVIRKLGAQSRELASRLGSFALTDVYARVVRLLMEVVDERNGVRVVPSELSQQDIANRVGASRSMINRIMRDLVRGGYLAQDRAGLVVRKTPPMNW